MSEANDILGQHRRQWRDCLYVYPVIARRSRGLSIGINLNPEKRCNFSCVYCQVDRSVRRGLHNVDLDILRQELIQALQAAVTGALWRQEPFNRVPTPARRINDIAFSGDGEPTCMSNFDRAVAVAAAVKQQMGLGQVKLVVITNATQLASPQVRRALGVLDGNNGEIWAKLDAGTQEYFEQVNRPLGGANLDEIVQSVAAVAKSRPIVIQTLLLRLHGQGPSPQELQAYCGRLRQILDSGGLIKLVQLHSIARQPAESWAQPLERGELEAAAALIRQAVAGVTVEVF